jgi:hypothetical protein
MIRASVTSLVMATANRNAAKSNAWQTVCLKNASGVHSERHNARNRFRFSMDIVLFVLWQCSTKPAKKEQLSFRNYTVKSTGIPEKPFPKQ